MARSFEETQAIKNMLRADAEEHFSKLLKNYAKITNEQITKWCTEYKEFGSENWIRGIIVPMLLENHGNCII